ncbi:MAG TPA: hypothetical protein VFS05_01145 [Gemmatimonadaceae bacterium]|nr:hypothetical protein [Gemmatimonadaceae bacterium]
MHRRPSLVWLAAATIIATACSDAAGPAAAPDDAALGSQLVPVSYTMIDLGPGSGMDINDNGAALIAGPDGAYLWTPGGGRVKIGDFFPTAMNDRGDVVGVTVFDYFSGQSLIWTAAGGARPLTTDPAAPATVATGINDRREVTGTASGGGCTEVFRWTPGGGLVLLSHDFGGACEVYGVTLNTRGTIVATVLPSVPNHETWLWNAREGWWQMAAGHDDSGENGSLATDINDRTEVSGVLTVASVSTGSFLWRPRTGFVELGPVAGSDGAAFGLNDFGAVVGYSYSYGAWVRTRWGVVLPLEGGFPTDINNQGRIIGTSVESGTPHAVLWVPSDAQAPAASVARQGLFLQRAPASLRAPAPVPLGASICLVGGTIVARPCAALN